MMPEQVDATIPAMDAAPAAEPAPPRPSLRALASEHRATLAPWRWMIAADVVGFIAHYVSPGLGQAALTAAGASAIGACWAGFQTREDRLAKMVKTKRTRLKIQQNAKAAVIAGSLWEMVAATWTPVGPHGAMQLTLLGGGLAVAAPHLYRNRRREQPVEPTAQIAAPVEDERISRFRVQFCATGHLQEARIHNIENIAGGFRFHIEGSLAHRGSFRDVKNIEDQIAALYDVPTDHVSVEPPENRSARRAVVTVLTETKAHERDEPWDGRSTYDPQTGTFILGRFADGSRSRWTLHVPGSGAFGGMCVGNVGSGKTGTMHVITSEAGLAKLCPTCLDARECPQCELRRICAVWVGDPQRQPLGVWRSRADVTAWGPLSCVRMLSWLHAGMRNRADYFGRMEWTDHLGRVNHGKGWFDPTPQFPMMLGVIDEWSIIENDPQLAAFAVPLAEQIEDEGRKVGVRLLIGDQDADVGNNGTDRGFRLALTAMNAISHRSDVIARRALNLEGNPAELPEGVHGVSYLRSFDKRSGIVHRTKHLREYLRPGESGVDVREITERIARDPITYDPAVLGAITALGYTGPGQVLDDEDGWDLDALLGIEKDDEEPEPTQHQQPAQTTGLVAAYDVATVREALTQHPDAEVFDLMAATQLSALDVSRALDVLITDGVAVQDPSGRYAPC